MRFLLLVALFLAPLGGFAQEVQKDVRLSAGDTIEIRYFYTPELNKTQIVRPDGKIVLQLVGEVVAAGKTPNELTQELSKKYEKYIKQVDMKSRFSGTSPLSRRCFSATTTSPFT
jgi:protein involved in polysaccharide export with SLBB domain